MEPNVAHTRTSILIQVGTKFGTFACALSNLHRDSRTQLQGRKLLYALVAEEESVNGDVYIARQMSVSDGVRCETGTCQGVHSCHAKLCAKMSAGTVLSGCHLESYICSISCTDSKWKLLISERELQRACAEKNLINLFDCTPRILLLHILSR